MKTITDILKPEKDSGIVSINKKNYNLPVKKLFSNRSKFKVLKKDPILTRLGTVQNYINSYHLSKITIESTKKTINTILEKVYGKKTTLMKKSLLVSSFLFLISFFVFLFNNVF